MPRVSSSVVSFRTLVPFVACLTAAFCLIACGGVKPTLKQEVAAQGLFAAALSQDGQALVVGSILHGGSFWRVSEDAQRHFDWNHGQGQFTEMIAVAVSRDGRFALTASGQQFVIWNTSTGESTGFWRAPARIVSAALSDGGAYALVGLSDSTALVFDIRQGGGLSTLNVGSPLQGVAISSDGGLGVTGEADGKVTVWVLKTGVAIRQWRLDGDLSVVTLSEDGRYVFAFSKFDGGAVWGASEDKLLFQLPLKHGFVTSARLNAPNHQLLMALSSSEIRLLDWMSGEVIHQWSVPSKSTWKPTGTIIYDVAQGSRGVVAVSSNGQLYRWSKP